MAFSFSRLIISESDSITCKKAFELVSDKQPQPEQRGTASCIGEIDGYKIWLGFRKGIPSWECSCPKISDTETKKPCVHVVALSLAWDRSRGVPDPSPENIQYLTQEH